MATKINHNNSIKSVIKGTPFEKVKLTHLLPALKAAKSHFGFNLSTTNGMVGALRYIKISVERN